ncbi:MAG: autotransporter-associated beta strand repeat-containing protein [Phycisphaerae bacterium]
MQKASARKLAILATACILVPTIPSAFAERTESTFVQRPVEYNPTPSLRSLDRFQAGLSFDRPSRGGVSLSVAQTGIWTGGLDSTVVGGALAPQLNNWFDEANWLTATGSPGPIPLDGGEAIFSLPEFAILPYVTGGFFLTGGFPNGVILDQNVTLSAISYDPDNPGGTNIYDSPAPTTITIQPGAPLQINAFNLTGIFDGAYNATLPQNVIQPNIAGSDGVVVTGFAPVFFTGAKTFTGGLLVQDGIVGIGEFTPDVAAQGGIDAATSNALGAGTVTLDNGELRYASDFTTPEILNLNKAIVLGEGGGTFNFIDLVNVTGNISGTGDLTVADSFSAGVNFNAPTSFTGTLFVETFGNPGRTSFGLTVGQTGSFATESVVVTGLLRLNNQLNPTTNRLADTATVSVLGGEFEVTSAFGVDAREKFGTLEVGGTAQINARPLANNRAATVAADTLARVGNGGVLFTGTNVGATTGTRGVFQFGNGESLLVGGDGSAGTNDGIIPWAYAATTTSNNQAPTGFGNASFVTYVAGGVAGPDGDRGIVPLVAADYATFGTAAVDSNVLQSANVSLAAPQTVNALRMDLNGGAPVTLSGSPVTITSGAILNNGLGNVISADVNFGSAEGVIIGSTVPQGTNDALDNGLLISGDISGTGGLTKLGGGNLYLTGANTFSGPVNIESGGVRIAGDVLPNVAGPLGQSTDLVRVGGDLTFNDAATPATVGTRLIIDAQGGTAVFGRDLALSGPLERSGNSLAVNNGNLQITGGFNIDGEATIGGDVGSEVIVDSNLTGAGILNFISASTITLNGDNAGFAGGFVISPDGAGDPTPTVINFNSPTALPDGTLVRVGNNTVFNATQPVNFSSDFFVDPDALFPVDTIEFNGNYELSGFISFNGNWQDNALVVGSGSDVAITGLAPSDLSFIVRGKSATDVGTVTLAAPNALYGQVIAVGDVGADGLFGTADDLPGILRVTADNGLGIGLVTNDTPNSTILFDASAIDDTPGLLEHPNATLLQVEGPGFENRGVIRATGGTTVAGPTLVFFGDSTIGVDSDSTLELTDGFIQGTSGGVTIELTTTVTGGGTLRLPRLADAFVGDAPDPLTSLAITGNTDVEIIPGGTASSTSIVNELSISPGSSLDLTDNDLVIDYADTDPSPLVQVRSLLFDGRLDTSFDEDFALGYIEASAFDFIDLNGVDPLDPAYVEGEERFLGDVVGIDDSAILVLHVYKGDINLDGVVGLEDFNILAANFGKAGSFFWEDGDLDYDGTVGLGDFNLLASVFGLPAVTVGPTPTPEDFASLEAAIREASIPEPTSLAAIGLMAGGLLRRRRAC